jgi:hypothetical protein
VTVQPTGLLVPLTTPPSKSVLVRERVSARDAAVRNKMENDSNKGFLLSMIGMVCFSDSGAEHDGRARKDPQPGRPLAARIADSERNQTGKFLQLRRAA